MSTESPIKIERANDWATVLLNRPPRRNAVTGPMTDALADAVDALSADAGVAAIVLRGAKGVPVPNSMAWLWLKSSESVQTRMALVGDRVGSDDLLRLGLAAQVADDPQVRERAEAIAAHLAACPPGSARQIKASIRTTRPVDPEVLFSNTPIKALLTAAQVRQ